MDEGGISSYPALAMEYHNYCISPVRGTPTSKPIEPEMVGRARFF